METQERGAVFRQLVRDVAQFLSAEVMPGRGEEERYREIRVPGGPAFGMYLGGYGRENRVEISLPVLRYKNARGSDEMVTPRHVVEYGKAAPEISVALNRPARAIAADIARRFLPEATVVYQKMVHRIGEANAYEASTKGLLERLAAATGEKARPHSTELYLHGRGDTYARMSVQGESVRFESMSVPGSIALEIVKLLKEGP